MGKPSGHTSPNTVVVVVHTFNTTALICVGLRLWTRLRIVQQPGWDDLTIAGAMVFTTLASVCITQEVRYGLGRHAASLSADELTNYLRWFWMSIWSYYVGLGLAKLSIVLQCLRVFGHMARFRRWAWVLASVCFAFMVYTVIITVFLCRPVSHFWHPVKEGRCLPVLPIWFTNSSFNIVTDIATALLPLPVLHSLNMAKRQRIALMVVFGLGGAICIISIVRFHSLYAVAISTDKTWDNPLAALWAIIENTVGIIVGCLPTLKALVIRYCPALFGSSRAVSEEDRTGQSSLVELGKSRRSELIKGAAIKVTTVLEQVERKKDPWDEGREGLVSPARVWEG